MATNYGLSRVASLINLYIFLYKQEYPIMSGVELAENTDMRAGTCYELLKEGARLGLFTGLRGQDGGYVITDSPKNIKVVDLLEGVKMGATTDGARDVLKAFYSNISDITVQDIIDLLEKEPQWE